MVIWLFGDMMIWLFDNFIECHFERSEKSIKVYDYSDFSPTNRHRQSFLLRNDTTIRTFHLALSTRFLFIIPSLYRCRSYVET